MALRVYKICSKMLKALDEIGLSWLTCLFNIAWEFRTTPNDWQMSVVVLIFKKGDWRVSYRGVTLLTLPEKAYARVLERRFRSVV